MRDYLYVEDGAAAYMLLAERLAADRGLIGQALIFSMESRITVLQLVEMILKLMDSDLPPAIANEAVGEIRDQYLSASKARRYSVGNRNSRWKKACGAPSPGIRIFEGFSMSAISNPADRAAPMV